MEEIEKKANKMAEKVVKIIESCNDYEEVQEALKLLFVEITDINHPNFKHLNEIYDIKELGNSRCANFGSHKIKTAFGFKGKFAIVVELYLYEKAPNGVVVLNSFYDYKLSKKLPVFIQLWVDEKGNF